jgi:hypothetical protein
VIDVETGEDVLGRLMSGRSIVGSMTAVEIVTDLVIHNKAGEPIAGDIYLFKNNTDSAGNSYGCHENYLVGGHGEFGRLADILIPFLVTRPSISCLAWSTTFWTPHGSQPRVPFEQFRALDFTCRRTSRSSLPIRTPERDAADRNGTMAGPSSCVNAQVS